MPHIVLQLPRGRLFPLTYKLKSLIYRETQAKGDTDNRDGKQKRKRKTEDNLEIINRKKKKQRQSRHKRWVGGETERWRIKVEFLPSKIFTVLTDGSMQDIKVARLQNTRAQTPLSPSIYVRVSLRTVKIFLAQHRDISEVIA